MNWKQSIIDVVKGAASVNFVKFGTPSILEMAKGSTSVTSVSFGSSAVVSPENMKLYMASYLDLVGVYSSVYTIATEAATLELKLYSKVKSDKEDEVEGRWIKEEVVEHPALDLLEYVNDSMNFFDLMEATLIYMEINPNGEAFWEVVKDKQFRTTPLQLTVLRPDRVKIVPSPDGKSILRYEYKYSDKQRNPTIFSPDSIIHFKYFNPLDDWQGLGPTRPLHNTILLEEHSDVWNVGFFERGTVPPGVLEAEGSILTQKEADRVSAKFVDKYGGSGKAYSTPLLSGGLRWKATGTRPNEMEFPSLKELLQKRFYAAYGTNAGVTGQVEELRFDNYKFAMRMFYQHTLRPKMTKVASTLTHQLLPLFGEDPRKMFFEFDMTDVLGEDEEIATARDKELFRMASKSPNEIREARGEKPYDGGNQYYHPTTVMPLGAEPNGKGNKTDNEEFLDKIAKLVIQKLNGKGS